MSSIVTKGGCYVPPRLQQQFCLLLIIAVVLPLRTITADATTAVNGCFLYPSTLLDIGFTFNGNIARRQATRRLQLEFPVGVSITTHNLFRCKSANFTSVLDAMIIEKQCDIVLSLSSECFSQVASSAWNEFVQARPSVRFVNYFPRLYFTPPAPTNYRAIGSSAFAAWYAAGAAAAMECHTCVGFVHPLTATAPAANAFFRGMKFGTAFRNNLTSDSNRSTCPLIVVYLGSFMNVALEGVAADLFVERGCEVVAYWADTQTITQRIAALDDPKKFSIANNIDAGLLYGDSVLTSVLVDLTEAVYSYLRDVVLMKVLEGKFVGVTNGSHIGTLSPRASRMAVRAASAAFESQLENYSVWCGGFTDIDGNVLYTGCGSEELMSSFTAVEQGIVYYGRLPSATSCPPGTYAWYNASGQFSLTCLRCPVGTFSSTSGTIGRCSVCPSVFLTPNANQTGCVAVDLPDGSLSHQQRLFIIVFSSVGVAGIILFAIGFMWHHRMLKEGALYGSGKWRELSPPSGEFVACVALAVNPLRSVDNWRHDLNFACSVFEALEDAVWRAAREHQGYVLFTAADVYILAAPSVLSAVRMARAVETLFGGFSGLVALRFVVNAGRPTTTKAMASPQLEGGGDANEQTRRKADGVSPSPPLRQQQARKDRLDATQELFNGRIMYQGAVVSDLVFAFTNYKLELNASIVALPGCFNRALSTSGRRDPEDRSLHSDGDGERELCDQHNHCMVDLPTLIRQQSDCLFGVTQWPAAPPRRHLPDGSMGREADNHQALPMSLQQVTTITTPEMVLFATAAAERRLRKIPPSSSPGDDTTSSSVVVPHSDEWEGIVFDAMLLPDPQLMILLRYGTALTHAFLSVLDTSHRKQIVRVTAMRMHVRLNVNTARRTDLASNKVFFGEEQVIREVVAQVIRSFDEQQLFYWCREVAQMKRDE